MSGACVCVCVCVLECAASFFEPARPTFRFARSVGVFLFRMAARERFMDSNLHLRSLCVFTVISHNGN